MKNTMKKLTSLIAVLNAIQDELVETDLENGEWVMNWEPAYVKGIYNPTKAANLRRRTQAKIFSIMKKAGLPLNSFDQLRQFIHTFNGNNLQTAYWAALRAYPVIAGELKEAER